MSWGRRQPRLRRPGRGQGPRGRGPGQPQAHGCHGPKGLPSVPAPAPGSPTSHPHVPSSAHRPGESGAESTTGQARRRPDSLASSFSFGWFLLLKTPAPNQNIRGNQTLF